MKVYSIHTLAGPNIYTHHPALVMELDLEGLGEKQSARFPDFIDRLLDRLPGLREHHCARGRPGGFVERLHEGTYFGHVVEHVALELFHLAGIARNFGKTFSTSQPTVYKVVVEYIAEEASRFLLGQAVSLVEAVLEGRSTDVDLLLDRAREIAADTELGPSTRAIVDAAATRNIPYVRIGTESLVQFGYGRYRKRIRSTLLDTTSPVAVEIAQDKELTKKLLDQAEIPVPRGEMVSTEEELLQAAERIGAPFAVKPVDGSHGRGVSVELSTREELLGAFEIARSFSREAIVEKSLRGRDYRVLVVGGKVVSATERVAASVTGDGKSTLRALIDKENRNPMRGAGHGKPMSTIQIDEILEAYVGKQGFTLDGHIPPPGVVVQLLGSANMSTGASSRDVTDVVHGQIVLLCERAARAVGLDVCGIDLRLEDISRPVEGTDGGILEVNAGPGIRMHESPTEGMGRRAGEAVLNLLYPAGEPSRIPIVAVTGTNGKTTITRMIAFVIAMTDKRVGMTTTDGISIHGTTIKKGDMTGFHSARTVLSDTAVDVAVLETARGGLMRRGLAYDWSDVAVISNIQLDHVGQDDLSSLSDILHVKSVVAERVREGGTVVLNADDPLLGRLESERRVSRIPKNFVYFSLDGSKRLLNHYRKKGRTVYYVSNGWIMEMAGRSETPIAAVDLIPVTMMGKAAFNVSNTMAAVAACRAFGLSAETIARGLYGFHAHANNIGRANLFCVGNNHILLDYGHNPEAFRAVGIMAAWTGKRSVAVIGVPGDRDDSVIVESIRHAVRFFDLLIIREDADLRGRPKGEVAAIMAETMRREFPEKQFEVVLDEAEAVRMGIERLGDRDLLVLFFDRIAPVRAVLDVKGARQEECFLEDLFSAGKKAAQDERERRSAV